MGLLEEARLRSEIKKINTRIASIGKKFGKNSAIYKETIKGFVNVKANKFTSISKSGYVKLSYNIVKSKSKTAQKVLNIGKKVKTLTEIKKETIDELKRTNDLKDIDLKDIDVIYEIAESLSKIKDEFTSWLDSMYKNYTDSELKSNYSELYEKRGYRLTYKQLDELMERNKPIDATTPFD